MLVTAAMAESAADEACGERACTTIREAAGGQGSSVLYEERISGPGSSGSYGCRHALCNCGRRLRDYGSTSVRRIMMEDDREGWGFMWSGGVRGARGRRLVRLGFLPCPSCALVRWLISRLAHHLHFPGPSVGRSAFIHLCIVALYQLRVYYIANIYMRRARRQRRG